MDNEPKKRCCIVCKHHVDFVGEKGYCKIYRHETLLPEDACPLFEPCEEKKDINFEKTTYQLPQSSVQKNSGFKNFLIIISHFSCIVLTVVELFFGVNLGMMIASSETIPPILKVAVIFLSIVFMLLPVILFFKLIKKSVAAQVTSILFTVVVTFLVISNKLLWFTFFQFIDSMI